jgi:magnesium transporter
MTTHASAVPAGQAAGGVRVLTGAEVRAHGFQPGEGELVWIDLSPAEPEDIEWLGKTFHFHPVALEDVSLRHQRPKLDEYAGYSFCVLYTARPKPDAQPGFDTHELQVFWSPTSLITIHAEPLSEIDELAKRVRSGSLQPIVGAERRSLAISDLAYWLIDGIVDGYFPVIDRLAELSEGIEEEMFSPRRGRDTLQSIFSLKKELFHLRKLLAPSREVLNVLLRRDHGLFGDELYPYFQDVYDHVNRVIDGLDSYRDLLASLLDTYLSFVSNDVNQTVKRMTAVTAILMVNALIAGVYGMNFTVMPELQWQYGYPFALGLMLLCTLALVVLFRRIRWF